MRRAGRSLGDLSSAHASAAAIFAAQARATAPRLTGALANATQAASSKEGAGIANELPYFGPIHYGWPQRNIAAQPYVDEAVADTQSEWLDVYQHAAQAAADSVKGA